MTAVEWLEKKLIESGVNLLLEEFEFIQQALEMEKQQIIDAANIPKEQRWYEDKYNSCGEQYYFETYKKPTEWNYAANHLNGLYIKQIGLAIQMTRVL